VQASFKTGWEIGSVIAKYYKADIIDRELRAESSTGGHTSKMVPVFAAECFKGILDTLRHEYPHPAGK
jgi:alkaline phosphatase